MNFATFAAVLAIGALAWAGGPNTTPSRNTVTARKPVAKVAYRIPARSTVKRSVARRPAVTAAKRSGKKTPVVRTSWRNRQSAPSADRYREIQDALVARGYLASEDATGTWGPSSTDALKRFQAEQTLDTTGKIDSLSLIALGLGPRHDALVTIPRAADGNLQSDLGRN